MKWVIDGVLMRSSRPGYPSPRVSKELVDQWLARISEIGIRTIICLLDEDQLNYYSSIPEGLLGLYRNSGFKVIHKRIPDPAYHQEGWAVLEERLNEIYKSFQAAEKPVLIHCSAGQDRTGRVINYIKEQGF